MLDDIGDLKRQVVLEAHTVHQVLVDSNQDLILLQRFNTLVLPLLTPYRIIDRFLLAVDEDRQAIF
jgi:hypothetical protein